MHIFCAIPDHYQSAPAASTMRKTAPAAGAAAAAKPKGKGKPELTEEQKQEIREAFDLFDTDGSGTYPW